MDVYVLAKLYQEKINEVMNEEKSYSGKFNFDDIERLKTNLLDLVQRN